MLIKCPECELQVSDKALSCPHCGNPLKSEVKNRGKNKSGRRRRLPNGFGQITEIKGKNLRNRFRVLVTVGKTPEGKYICKLLKPNAYFATYNEAYAALIEYNRNPYDLDSDMTMRELYDKWVEIQEKKDTQSYMRTVTSAWQYCSSIYGMRVKDVRARHIKGCMTEGYRIETRGKNKGRKVYAPPNTQARIKSVLNLLLDYAVENELTNMNYSRTFDLSDEIISDISKTKRGHVPFTSEEMDVLWNNVGKIKYVDWILIQCYMGWRPQELVKLKLDEINIDDWYMTGGMKTDAGKQRIVPIHTKIREFVKQNYDFAKSIGSEYLINEKGQTHSDSWKMTYDKYNYRFEKTMDALNIITPHRPHDPRVTFVTMGKKAGVDEYALKEMVGHSIQDVTESTYTVRDVEWLRSDLEKIQ